MTKKSNAPTLSDVVLAINGVRTQLSDTQSQIKAMKRRMVSKDNLDAAIAGLATKDQLDAAVSKLATKDELDAAVTKLATKDELSDAVANLATKSEFQGLKETVQQEAGDLGESIHALSNMIDQRFKALKISSSPKWRKHVL